MKYLLFVLIIVLFTCLLILYAKQKQKNVIKKIELEEYIKKCKLGLCTCNQPHFVYSHYTLNFCYKCKKYIK
jgi:hypothetical protein